MGYDTLEELWDTRRSVISLEPNHGPIDIDPPSRAKISTTKSACEEKLCSRDDFIV